MALTLLIGGARAGKSSLAVRLAGQTGAEVAFIATAMPSDTEMRRRIEQHRADRPKEWSTIEEPTELIAALDEAGDRTAIVDCLTLWVSNLLLDDMDSDEIYKRAEEAAAAAAKRSATTLVVTNEVGSGVHPATPLGRRFRDDLGRVNAIWSAHADEAYLVVAGRALRLEEWP